MSQHSGGPGGSEGRPTGTIRLTVQGSTFMSGLTPTVFVSGHRINARFGVQDIPVWAGPNRVDAHTQWMRRYGQASLTCDVPPGGVVPVFYAVPWHQFTGGAMGHVKQSRPGLAVLVALLAVLVGIPVLLAVVAAALGA